MNDVVEAAVVAALVGLGLSAPRPAAAYSVLAHEANIDALWDSTIALDQTQPHRKEAAAKGEAVPNQTSASGADEAVRVRQRTLAHAIQITVRPAAQQGDILSPAMADLIRRQLATAFGGPKADIIRPGHR